MSGPCVLAAKPPGDMVERLMPRDIQARWMAILVGAIQEILVGGCVAGNRDRQIELPLNKLAGASTHHAGLAAVAKQIDDFRGQESGRARRHQEAVPTVT